MAYDRLKPILQLTTLANQITGDQQVGPASNSACYARLATQTWSPEPRKSQLLSSVLCPTPPPTHTAHTILILVN